MGVCSGAVSVLVLSGEATKADLANSNLEPDFVLEDVGQLGRLLEEARA